MAFMKKEWKNGEVGETPITSDELNRIEQGIADNETEIKNKQDSLTAGDNITIENGVISASGGEVDFLTLLYSASSHTNSGELSESINNFYGILLVSHFSTYNVKGSVFLPSEIASQTNIPVRTNNPIDLSNIGVNVIISGGGKTLQISQFDNASHLTAVYGVFRK